ncbi:MAG: SNF2-related protein [Polyangiales bacterium]
MPPSRRARFARPLSWPERVKLLLAVPNVAAKLTGRQLFTAACVFAPPRGLSADEAAEILHAQGLPRSANPHKLVERMAQAARDSPHRFHALAHERFVPFGFWTTELVETFNAFKIPAVTEPPPVTPTSTAKKAPAKKALAKKSAAVVAPAPPAPPPAPSLPAGPAFVAATPRVDGLDAAALSHEFTARDDGRAVVLRALRAQALGAAQQFEELLSPATMSGVSSFPYQVETVRRVLRVFRGRGILADEVGLGKTVEALMVLREYQLRGMVRRALVLVPAGLVGQWVEELASKAHVTARSTDDPAHRDDLDRFWNADGVVVASLAYARHARNVDLARGAPWDMVVVDEAHRVKNRATASYKLVDGLRARFLLLLTATPVENDLEEIYNLVTLLRPGQFEGPAAFRRDYVDPKDPTSPRNRERLKSLLAEVMVRNTRAQSGLALPPRFVTTVTVTPDERERALYDAAVSLFREHNTGAARMATSTLLLEAGSSPRALRGGLERMAASGKHGRALGDALRSLRDQSAKVTATRKVEALAEVLRAGDDATLVFTRFRDTLAYLAEAMKSLGVTHGLFHGGMDAPSRRAAVEGLRDGRTRVLLATDAGAEGHNLQFCHQLVNFDLPWNPMVIEQRIGRLHRMGQTEPVRVFNLCAKGTIEDRVLDVLDRRVQLFELVVGEMDMVLGNLTDERDLEDRLLALYADAKSEGDIDAGFDALADELLSARRGYERTKKLDEALFGRDFES